MNCERALPGSQVFTTNNIIWEIFIDLSYKYLPIPEDFIIFLYFYLTLTNIVRQNNQNCVPPTSGEQETKGNFGNCEILNILTKIK